MLKHKWHVICYLWMWSGIYTSHSWTTRHSSLVPSSMHNVQSNESVCTLQLPGLASITPTNQSAWTQPINHRHFHVPFLFTQTKSNVVFESSTSTLVPYIPESFPTLFLKECVKKSHAKCSFWIWHVNCDICFLLLNHKTIFSGSKFNTHCKEFVPCNSQLWYSLSNTNQSINWELNQSIVPISEFLSC